MNQPDILSPVQFVEDVLRGSTEALSLEAIANSAAIPASQAREALKQLAKSGQIELIPGGRNGNRYALLRTTPDTKEPDAPLSGVEKELVSHLAGVTYPVPTEGLTLGGTVIPAPAAISSAPAATEQRYMVRVPKRKPRILHDHDKAQAAALAAVRSGAPYAEVFQLIPAGKANRGAVWQNP
ncbi:hypothetical protein ACSBPU_13035 [Parapusillimonas sp. JC17]|uniref:hypothetical protein n=1 Tax=Parapusillimonas sp. JC17 TaxID=3445768 RepID=UPI003F9EE088